MKLSICIPTYNRAKHLLNCLNSIYLAKKNSNINFEVCVSDNGSDYDVEKITEKYKEKIKLKLNKNKENLGYHPNLLESINLASGEFVWAIGDDDLLMPNSLKKINILFKKYHYVDFFCNNSYNLNYKFLDSFDKPFDTKNLPKTMEKFSKKKESFDCSFWELIDYNIAFDFLNLNCLNIYKRQMWLENVKHVNHELLKDRRPWSNFENTHAHIKIYANAFKNSKAFFNSDPLTVNLYGVREWNDLYPFIEVVRLPEILDYYRSQGLGFKRYVFNKNYSLRNFMNYFFKILFLGKKGGLNYVNFYRHIFLNLLYPNVYLSFFKFIFRKIQKILN